MASIHLARAAGFTLLIALITLALPAAAFAALKEIRLHPDRHYLMHADGSPFFFLGDTQWRLSRLGAREDIDAILDNRKAKGFTAIQLTGLFHGVSMFGWSPYDPNVYGDRPGTPGNWNEAFWRHVDYAVDATIARGMHPILFPAWGTIAGGELNIFSSNQQAYDFGVWFANRYKNRPGIIYVVGGDRDPHPYVEQIAKGIKAVDPQRLVSFHPLGSHSSSESYNDRSWLDFNDIQTGHGVCDDSAEFDHVQDLISPDWSRAPTRPVINMEPRYENWWCSAQVTFDDDQVRVSAWWSVFAGSFGISYAHNKIWSWGTDWSNGTFHTDEVYAHLDSPASFQVQYIKKLMLSRPFFSRVPDTAITNHRNGLGATRGDGYIMVYFSRGQTADIDTASLAGKQVKAWWYRAKNGDVQSAGGFTGGGVRRFDPPGSEGKGNDWVLVLDDASRGFPPPGSPYSEGYALASNHWAQISLPCDPGPGNTLATVFGDDLPGEQGRDWAFWTFDGSSYRYVHADARLTPGRAYWAFQDSGATVHLDLPADCQPPTLTASAQCVSADGCFETSLATRPDTVTWNMLGMPFTHAVNWNDLRIVTDGGACAGSEGCTPAQAASNGVFHDEAWRYVPDQARYTSISGNAAIPAWSGFWSAAMPAATSRNTRLLMP